MANPPTIQSRGLYPQFLTPPVRKINKFSRRTSSFLFKITAVLVFHGQQSLSILLLGLLISRHSLTFSFGLLAHIIDLRDQSETTVVLIIDAGNGHDESVATKCATVIRLCKPIQFACLWHDISKNVCWSRAISNSRQAWSAGGFGQIWRVLNPFRGTNPEFDLCSTVTHMLSHMRREVTPKNDAERQ